MWDLQRAGLQELPAQGVAGGWWLWDGASTGAAQRRHRPHVLERLRVGIRHRAHGDAQARRRRHPPLLRVGPSLLGTVLMRISYEWLGDVVELGDVPPKDAADVLTRLGIEVESLTLVDLSNILIG